MINRLKKNITILFALLLGILLSVILLFLNWMSYRNSMYQLKTEIRSEIRSVRWKQFSTGETKDGNLEDYSYCVVKVDTQGKMEMMVNRYPGLSESKLMTYADQIINEGETPSVLCRYTYIIKRKRGGTSYVVLIDGAAARKKAEESVAMSGIVLGLAVLFLIIGARMLSRWLVRPVEKMMQAEKKFMSNASHELKTPLTVISANAELLEAEVGKNKHLQYIRQETDRMTVLVNRMLTLVRLDSVMEGKHHTRFCMDEALLAVIYPMESVAYEKHIAMELQIQEEMYVVGDEEQIKSLMSILLDNAIAYTPEHGHIRVEADLKGRKFCLRVSNSGEAIPQEVQAKLFERFYRRDEARSGDENHFGLGLSIAASIVSHHNGTIRVESHAGENRFIVALPASMSNYVNKK